MPVQNGVYVYLLLLKLCCRSSREPCNNN